MELGDRLGTMNAGWMCGGDLPYPLSGASEVAAKLAPTNGLALVKLVLSPT